MNADWLKYIAKHHKEWTSIVRSWGAGEYSEDIVQEMYMKLLKYTTEEKIVKNGQVNKSYVWFTLRSIFLSAIKEQKKIKRVNITDNFDIEYVCELEESIAYSRMLNRIDEELDTWDWYDKMLFKLYAKSGDSIRDIAERSHISTTSIFHTLKYCKERIKDNVSEDYEDFKNEDYELI
jgi:DNA-directed RNA polymerase specialized sigma24 family protein